MGEIVLSDIYYKYWMDFYKNDKSIVNELIILKKHYPHFPFDHFIPNVFTDVNISYYGLDFLISTSKCKDASIYEFGRKSPKNLKKLKLYLLNNYLRRVDFRILSVLSFDELSVLNEFCSSSKHAEYINKLILFDPTLNSVKNISIKGISYFVSLKILDLVDNPIMCKSFVLYLNSLSFLSFLNSIDCSFYQDGLSISEIIFKYEKCNSQLSMTFPLKKEFQDVYNSILYGCDKFFPQDLSCENYFELRYKYILGLIDKDYNEAINAIVNFIYCTNVSALKLSLYDARNIFKYNKVSFKDLLYLFELNDSYKLRDFLNQHKYDINLFDFVEKKKMEFVSNNLSKSLTNFSTDENGIVYLNGQDFTFLLHKVKGYGNFYKANLFFNDFSEWYKKDNSSPFISTSLCSNDFLGLVNGSGVILGFNKLDNEFVIDMGNDDLNTKAYMVKSNFKSSKRRVLLPNDLINKTNKAYNEVVIKRYDEEKTLNPDFVFAKDVITETDRKVADFFNIPIYLFNSKKYYAIMNEDLEFYREHLDLFNYVNCLKRMYYSFHDSLNFQNEFSTEKLIRDFENLLDKVLKKDVDKSKYLEILYSSEEFIKFLEAKSFLDDEFLDYSLENVHKKIKKLKK